MGFNGIIREFPTPIYGHYMEVIGLRVSLHHKHDWRIPGQGCQCLWPGCSYGAPIQTQETIFRYLDSGVRPTLYKLKLTAVIFEEDGGNKGNQILGSGASTPIIR